MARIIPGVQVTVVKDVVPKQLAPSGILGAAGLVEHNPGGQDLVRIANWNDLVEKLGPGTAHSMPELRQALENGVFSVVAVPVASQTATAATTTVALAEGGGQALQLTARAAGTWANGLKVETALRSRGETTIGFDVTIARPDGGSEAYRNLSVVPGDSKYFPRVLAANSSVVQVPLAIRERTNASIAIALELLDSGAIPAVRIAQAEGTIMLLDIDVSGDSSEVSVTLHQDDGGLIQRYERTLPNTQAGLLELLDDLAGLTDYVVLSAPSYPAATSTTLTGGVDAGDSEYVDAVNKLVDAPEVDMVLASVQDFSDAADVISVYSGVIAHCEAQAGESKGRIGFGQVPELGSNGKPYSIDLQVEMASNLVSDRFALISPFGTVGAVIGRIGALSYFQSPTFKTLGGLGVLDRDLGVADQRALLQGNVVPVATERGRGTIVVRGITTDGDQLSVRRVADRAVRGVKQIGELFIGRLNNADQRAALKGALAAFLLQMEKDGALVPSTDGSDPAFKVDVYSSQQDFALGIVRIDMAVRPVRAIDFIYATVLVQV